MKVQSIESINRVKKNSTEVKAKKDLTSFGKTQSPISNNIDIKKSNAAIKTTFLSNVSFKGHSEHFEQVDGNSYDKYVYGTSGAIHTKLVGSEVETNTKDERLRNKFSYDDYTNQEKLEKKLIKVSASFFYPNSSIEETRINNAYKTGRVYFADPEEIVNIQTKKDHDYIVYDNKPQYPSLDSVNENYFSTNKQAENYGQHFKTISEYYERLEAADLKSIQILRTKQRINNEDNKDKIDYYKSRIKQSDNEIVKANKAFEIFDEVGLLFMAKDAKIREINHSESRINQIPNEIKYLNENIDVNKERLSKSEKYLTTLQLYVDTQKEMVEFYPLEERTYYEDDKKFKLRQDKLLNEKLKDSLDRIEKLKIEKSVFERKIANDYESIKNKNDESQWLKQILPICKDELASVMDTLSEKYYKMEEFYKDNIE